MKKLFALAVFAATLTIGVADAGAWNRTATVHGPYGGASGSASGGCAGGVCTRSYSGSRTYYGGGTATRSGSGGCGGGSCSGSRTTTGPLGNSVTRNGSVSRY